MTDIRSFPKTNILVFISNPTTGGAATETLIVTGLLATDTVLAVTQMTKGSGNIPLLGWSGLENDAIDGHWVGDPVIGAVLLITVKR